ncbi:hypothetical protein HAX54_031463 [Datura stramonium]|uniref:Uncharacterized protein n=1 Tax=Datura stramonium TaxID=4076 RepID=A0ABS8VCF7_DATST|nr:hypothetical protein [Datura stramonium]
MTESDESNTAANVLVSIENPESSQRRADVRNDKKMTHQEQELAPKTPAPEHFPKSACLPKKPLANSGLPSITPTNLPNPDKQTLYVPNCANGPQNSPHAVRNAPNLSLPIQVGSMSAYLTAQHRPGAHVVTFYDAHVPPVYTFEAPTYTTPVIVRVPYEVDEYA